MQSDILGYWLEEAQELELLSDPMYDTLSDLNERVQKINRAFKSVSTQH